MSEPKTAPEHPASEEAPPKLVAVSESKPAKPAEPAAKAKAPEPSRDEPPRKGVSRLLFGLVLVLWLLALGGLYAQTQRATAQAEQIAVLSDQVQGLEVELSAAKTQLTTYEMQFSLVEDSLAEIYQKMGSLLEFVSLNPESPPAAEPPPETR